ncbi:hypothetical protein COL154_013627 [Colletotrichum chrysophilum]|nr:hypothetical protein KNSL1_013444 [Colletotrichum chrysophilum]KAJ0349176.1 hypothetical protein COL154_013627 [Colletotrichum chrysophilum]
MSSLRRLPNPQMYTVGWITALAKELTAAQAVLDEEHQKPENFRKHPKDTNNYIWGRIGDHNIVIASLAAGKYGTVSAASTAWSMISSLPQLRSGLMVGIGAGIPKLADNIDICLGDVVVSQPTRASLGVVQYDVGKLESDGHFKRVGSLAPPPEVLLKGLATLKAKRRLGGPRKQNQMTLRLCTKGRKTTGYSKHPQYMFKTWTGKAQCLQQERFRVMSISFILS